MPVGQGARNNIVLGGLGRPQLFDTNIKATMIDADIFTDHEVLSSTDDADLILVLDTSEDPDKIKYITRADITGGFPVLTGSTNNTVVTVTGSEAIAGEANLLFDGTILTNDGGEVNIDISSGDPHLSFQIGGTDKFTIGVDDNDSDILKIDTGGAVGGATKVSLDSSGNMTLAGNLTVTGNLLPAADDTHDIGSASAAFQDLFLEGDITLTDAGTIATSAGDLTVDAEGDIILDANGANVTFKDDGTSILDIANSSTDVEITVSTADKNLKFKGTDGSSAITALDIDMATAGTATFNSDVVVGSKLKMPSNTADKLLIADGSSFEEVAIGDLSEISSIDNNDVFLAIDADAGSLKKVLRSTIVAGTGTGSEISNVVEDSTPQLGGDLDVNGNDIVSTSNGNISLLPNGSGKVIADGNGSSGGISLSDGVIDIRTGTGSVAKVLFYCESSNAHAQTLQAQPHSAGVTNTLTLPAGSSSTLVSLVSTDTLTNKTLTSPVINTGTFGTSILPVSADGTTLGSATKEFSDLFLADGGQILFGDDQEITLTHVADDGLILKHVGTADGKEPSFSFHAGDNDIAANDVLGSIFFKAPDEGAGTDAILVAAGIEAVSEGDFAADNNATKLSFLTGASEAASEKMSLSSAGNLTVAGDLTISGDDLFMNTNTAGHILVGDDTNYNPVAVSGDIALASNGAVTIQSGAVEHGMLADDIISGQAEITSGLAAADELLYSDDGTVKRVGLDTLATKLFSVASAGTVAQASDHMLFLDGGATGDVIVESIDDFLSAIAGSGISVSSSQLTASGTTPAADDIQTGDGAVNIVTTSGNITLDAQANDADVIIKVDDGGSAVTAVTFDGSDEGNAIFVNDIQLKSDDSVIKFGADLDVSITHDPDDGLFFKSAATADNNPFVLTLQTGETDIAADDIIGTINFQAPDEGTGTDAILVAAGIQAVSEGDFAADANATRLEFLTAASEAAAAKMTLSSAGVLDVDGGITVDNITIDGTEIDLSSGDLTIDVAGDIILDAGGNDFKFSAGGTEVLNITNSSSDVIIKPVVDAKDIIFQQRDGTEVARVEDNGTFNIVTDKLAINATAVTATAAELNLLDGGTSVGGSITLADSDGVVVNDGGTMKTIPASDVKTYAAGSAATKGFATAMAIAL